MRKSIYAPLVALAAVIALAGCVRLPSVPVVPVETPPAQSEPTPAPDTITPPVEPELTVGQMNAIGSAQSYLDYTGFSRTGLIDQLAYEGFSAEDATFAVDTIAPDWNAEAAETAASYLSYTSFSRQGLYDQLIYEGFTDAEANFGLASVGY